ncbi:ParC family partition-associated protein [Shinella yambaruensis]|uniref:Partition protein C n=2 Tax=Shinella yambaruensis TaxID=415996 RepID=A0ABQ5ZTE0_9HYPH|nr:ParC family partition-associated protein [Shinella yambaruensis]GLR55212.1 hypothetical protein GCM10007923_64340 [Shinella yambaruensis]
MNHEVTDSLQVVEPKVFRELVATGAIQSVSVRAVEQGLIVVVTIGDQQRVLGLHRGGARYFQSVDGAASVLQQNGITQFDADLVGWTPRTQPKGSRIRSEGGVSSY